jgi:cell division protein ZapA (FtsZ GTPase activity inhibitor)
MKNIIISEKQLEKLTNRVKNSLTENQEEGSYMAKQQLFTIATLAHKMWEEMEDGEELEDWMETKIAQSEQSIISVVKTFMYDEVSSKTSNDGMGKLSFDDLIIGK